MPVSGPASNGGSARLGLVWLELIVRERMPVVPGLSEAAGAGVSLVAPG